MERIYESAAETAKKVRAALKKAFPGVKFSVRSSTYSMGSSVYVRWTDGPTSKEVDAILSRFESSSFDGMEDLKTSHGYVFEGKLYSGADYVSGSREMSAEYKAQVEAKAVELGYAPDMYGYFNKWEIEEAEMALRGVVSEEVVEVATVEEVATTSEVIEVTVIRNEEKDGIEVIFSGKPNRVVIEQLREYGFRWHGVKKLWYAKFTEERLLIAEGIASIFADIAADLASESSEEVAPVAEAPASVESVEESAPIVPVYNKIPVVDIVITRAEGPRDADFSAHSFRTFADASAHLATMAATVSHDNGYDKVDFVINYADGEEYRGTVDLKKAHTAGYDLAKHVHDAVAYRAGIKCPDWMDSETYEAMTAKNAEAFRVFYKNYQIGDGEKLAAPVDAKTYVKITSGDWSDSFLYSSWSALDDIPAEIEARYTWIKERGYTYQVGNHYSVTVPPVSGNVVAFRPRSKDSEAAAGSKPAEVVSLSTKRAQSWESKLTAEQRLKLTVLGQFLDAEEIARAVAGGISVDDLFKIAAEVALAKQETR